MLPVDTKDETRGCRCSGSRNHHANHLSREANNRLRSFGVLRNQESPSARMGFWGGVRIVQVIAHPHVLESMQQSALILRQILRSI